MIAYIKQGSCCGGWTSPPTLPPPRYVLVCSVQYCAMYKCTTNVHSDPQGIFKLQVRCIQIKTNDLCRSSLVQIVDYSALSLLGPFRTKTRVLCMSS